MVFFDLESADGVLYKLEAAKIEGGSIKRSFCVFTDCGTSGRVREPAEGCGQKMGGVSEGEAAAQFLEFLRECGAVGQQQTAPGGIKYLPIDCAGFGVCRELQKVLFRYGVRVTFSQNAFRGDLCIYAKTYCSHLPIKSFRFAALCKHFGINSTGLQGVCLLAEALQGERERKPDAEQCKILQKKLFVEAEKTNFLPKMTDRVSADLARLFLFDVGIFCDTIIGLYENTKRGNNAADDWRRVLSGVERQVMEGERGGLFAKSLPESLQRVYPPVLTCRILDGEGRVGANLIEIAYKGNKILLECGTELETTEYGERVRKRIFQNRYDVCIVTHYHADHAALLDRMQAKTAAYIGPIAKKILQATTGKLYKNVREYNGKFFVGEICVTPFLCDHSALDSYMLLFEAGGKSILYTGDFRAHGRKSFEKLLFSLPEVDILICEHTNADGKKQWSEKTLEEKFAETMEGEQDVYVLTSATNLDRIVTVYKACLRTRRIMIVDRTQAKILDTVGGSIPHPRSHHNIKVLGEKGCTFADLALMQAPYAMLVRSSMGKEMEFLLETRKEAQCIYSMWKGYLEKADMKKFMEIFQKRNVQIKVLHTSGHADGMAIRKLRERTKPKKTRYVHGEKR